MTSLIKIGNSQGIRLPKAIIKQAHLENKELEFEVLDNGLLVKPIKNQSRVGWEEGIKRVLASNKNKKDDGLIDELLNDSDLEDFIW